MLIRIFANRGVLLALALVAAAAAVDGQQPAPAGAPAPEPATGQPPLTFKVEVDYVEVDATVTDAAGHPLRDLRQDDFEVLEDGQRQRLTVFSHVEVPIERPDPPLFRASPVEPDVATNRRAFDGRLFVLVLDDLHTDVTRTARVRAAASRFIERHLGANDLTAIVTTGAIANGSQEFTSSRARLLAAVNRFSGRRLPSVTRPALRSSGGAPAGADDAEQADKARRMLAALQGVSDFLAGVRGRRKSVVLFSEGTDYDISNQIANRYASDISNAMRAAVASATRGNVSYYAVDPRGLVGVEDQIEMASPSGSPGAAGSPFDSTRRSQDMLRLLAEETGGLAVVNRNDYEEPFARIIRENSSYYVLGYYSDNTKRDGRFRKVDVRVRRPGALVRARRGYTASRRNPAAPSPRAPAAASPEIREALASPVPVGGLPFTASAVPFRGADGRASVLVVLEVDGSRFQFPLRDGKPATDLELLAVPFDAGGRARDGQRDTITITPRAESRAVLVARGIRILRRLELPPGRYALKLAVRETASGAVGSLGLDLDVPDFSKGPLVMSGLVLTSAAAAATPTARPDEMLADVLPRPPTVRRVFPRGDELSVFAEIYDHVRGPHRVEIGTTVTDDGGALVYSQTDTRGSDELQARGDGFGHVRTLPLKEMPPGRYVLRVAARPLTSPDATVSRELEFTIR